MRLSIRLKLLLAFVLVIATGYLLILYFLAGSERERLTVRAIGTLHHEAEDSARELKKHLLSLQREVGFLSRLDLMDDIVVKDLDRRIGVLLEKKARDLNEPVGFFVFDTAANPVVTAGAVTQKPEGIGTLLKGRRASFRRVYDTSVLFAAPIYASFDSQKLLGWLVLSHPLANLGRELRRPEGVLAWIEPDASAPPAARKIFEKPSPSQLRRHYLYVLHPLDSVLSGWKLGYAIPKERAFATIREFEQVLWKVFLVMLALVGVLTVLIDRRIVAPIRHLSRTVARIIRTGEYDTRIDTPTRDEIGDLAESFRRLMGTVSRTLATLEEQNRRHASTLEALMLFFEKIAQSRDRESALRRACEELQRLTGARSARYLPCEEDRPRGRGEVVLPLRRESEGRPMGEIRLAGIRKTVAMEERFFESAARMIALQIERIELLETTKEALESKTSFFSALSHELRTPLGSILSLTQYLITSSRCDDEAKGMLGNVEHSASHLLQIINDILLMARAESGRLEPSIRRYDARILLQDSIEMIAPLAEAKGIALLACLPEEALWVATDEKLFRRVVINLLANAVKYTEKGEVTVRAAPCGDEGIEVVVEDTGIGIGADALRRVFEEFYREHRVREQEGGSGIGLTLSLKIARLLGGTLRLESEGEGKGTKAVFSLCGSRNPRP